MFPRRCKARSIGYAPGHHEAAPLLGNPLLETIHAVHARWTRSTSGNFSRVALPWVISQIIAKRYPGRTSVTWKWRCGEPHKLCASIQRIKGSGDIYYWDHFFGMLRGACKKMVCLTGGDDHVRLYESFASAVLQGAGTQRSPGRSRVGLPHTPRKDLLAGPWDTATDRRPGDRAAGGDFADLLHRRISTGYGNRQRTGAVLFRGRGREAGYRKGKNEVFPGQKLIRYTKRWNYLFCIISNTL